MQIGIFIVLQRNTLNLLEQCTERWTKKRETYKLTQLNACKSHFWAMFLAWTWALCNKMVWFHSHQTQHNQRSTYSLNIDSITSTQKKLQKQALTWREAKQKNTNKTRKHHNLSMIFFSLSRISTKWDKNQQYSCFLWNPHCSCIKIHRSKLCFTFEIRDDKNKIILSWKIRRFQEPNDSNNSTNFRVSVLNHLQLTNCHCQIDALVLIPSL